MISTISIHAPGTCRWGWSLPNILAAASCDSACTTEYPPISFFVFEAPFESTRLVFPKRRSAVDEGGLIFIHPLHPGFHPFLMLLGSGVFHHLFELSLGSHIQHHEFFDRTPPLASTDITVSARRWQCSTLPVSRRMIRFANYTQSSSFAN